VTTRLSLIVITRNEAANLPACLESCSGLADEFVVVDDSSEDGTAAIAEKLGAKVFQRRLDGFGAQKQHALERATGEWVLSLDADERLTPELKTEIAQLVSSGPGCDGYRLRRENVFMGRTMRHTGLGAEWKLRLFRRRSARFNENVVHEDVAVEGAVGALSSPFLHRPYESLSKYLAKLEKYTTLGAQQARREGERFRAADHLRLPLEFFKRYLLQLGCLDGAPGYVWSALAAFSAWLKRLKIRELEQAQTSRPAREPIA
jgi:glycosyltransferase involved in cell wall biosynthesis